MFKCLISHHMLTKNVNMWCEIKHLNIRVFNFTPHVDKECSICINGSKRVVGRKRVLKQVNQYSETSHCISDGTVNSLVDSESKEHTAFEGVFQPLSVKVYAEQLGFALVNSDDSCVMYAIFVRRDLPFLQIRNLLTLTITNDGHWKVHIDDKDVTSEKIFSSFDETLNESSCKAILSLCTKSVFCCGNQDFVDLCESRREEG